jgi:NADH-quinone oxidoreductase subunit G
MIGGVARAEWGEFGETGPMDAAPFAARIANFYMTDPISRASMTMAECTRAFGPAALDGPRGPGGGGDADRTAGVAARTGTDG